MTEKSKAELLIFNSSLKSYVYIITRFTIVVFCSCMKKSLLKFIITFICGYIILFFISKELANFVLVIFLLALPFVLFFSKMVLDAAYKNSISMVPKKYVFNQYTVYNDHCTIKYTPDEKIVVIENVLTNKKDIRTFTILKSRKVNINKCWNQVCKIFDGFICIDSLVSFFSYETEVTVELVPRAASSTNSGTHDSIKTDSSYDKGSKFVDIDNIRPDSYADGTNKQREYADNFVNIENIRSADKTKEREIKAPEFQEMGDILYSVSRKIDVNKAAASELSLLPGINIVIAKKLVEYRDLNGMFKSEDDFINAASVNEHFIRKIKSMITLVSDEPPAKYEDDNDGRVIDF